MSTPFTDALTTARLPVIMEIKPRHPDGSDLLAGRTVAGLVAEYEAAGAPCISVVTGRWFGGTPDLLREVAELTGRPLLRKDFVTRRDQIEQTRRLGASAVLLTAGLLPRSALRTLVDAALTAGLTPFVEVTSEAEIEAVPHAADCVVAVNNKDIKVRERDPADLGRSLRLLPAAVHSGAGAVVSASGIERPADAATLLDAGFTGLLVGTSLLRSTALSRWLDELDGHRHGAVPEPVA